MIGLLCFVLAVLAPPFKSKMRLEAEKRGASASVDCFEAWAAWPRTCNCPPVILDGPGHTCPQRDLLRRPAAAFLEKPKPSRRLDRDGE
jgi:hypothetical protein